MSSTSDNKRIAQNTILLYIRTVIVLVISLYTSRLILKALGVDDLGIYNVVGGIVLLMGFFRNALARATSRFITYEIGNGSGDATLNRVFTSAMTIHIIIAAIALLLGETVGYYIFKEWTVIPAERLQAAFIVYQCSLIIFVLQLMTTPYESVIIAHEDMNVYAYLSILSVVLKLGVVLLLFTDSADRLILYGVLLVLMDFLLLLIYMVYSNRKYLYLHFILIWDKTYSRQMFAFSGWTLLGSSTNAATQQGVSLLFNNFIGLVANTALGFASQVNSALQSFVGSFQTAFNPQVIKLYAQNDLKQMRLLMTRASKYSFMLAYVIALPLIANMEFVLGIWLGDVPKYTVEFCQLILICCIIDSTTGVLNTAITATGNIKGFQIGISISFILDLLTAALLLVIQFSPVLVFASRIITRGLINMAIELYFVRKQLKFRVRSYIKDVLIPIILTGILTVPPIFLITINCDNWLSLLISCSVSVVLCGIITYFIFFNKHEREVVINSILARIKR